MKKRKLKVAEDVQRLQFCDICGGVMESDRCKYCGALAKHLRKPPPPPPLLPSSEELFLNPMSRIKMESGYFYAWVEEFNVDYLLEQGWEKVDVKPFRESKDIVKVCLRIPFDLYEERQEEHRRRAESRLSH